MPNSILLASDLTSRTDRALERCELLGLPFTIAHVVAGEEPLTETLRGRLHDIAREDSGDAHGVAEILIVSGSVPETLARLAAERGCSLIATGIASFDSPKDYILGTTVDFLVRRADVPILVVKRKPRRHYRSLVVATDFSSCSHRALEAAAHLLPQAQIRLLHAFRPPFPTRLDSDETIPYIRNEREREMQAFVAALPSALRERVEPEVVVAPLVSGSDAHARGMRCLLDPQAMVDHSLHKQGSTARRKTGMFMQVHPGLLEGWLIRTSSLPGSPRMNNLLRDHT